MVDNRPITQNSSIGFHSWRIGRKACFYQTICSKRKAIKRSCNVWSNPLVEKRLSLWVAVIQASRQLGFCSMGQLIYYTIHMWRPLSSIRRKTLVNLLFQEPLIERLRIAQDAVFVVTYPKSSAKILANASVNAMAFSSIQTGASTTMTCQSSKMLT